MEPIEKLYYALGEVSYAIAKADGIIQQPEKEKLRKILTEEFKKEKAYFSVTEIIFHVLQKEGMDSKTAFDWALMEMRTNSVYVSETFKRHAVEVIKKVAAAFPPVTLDERGLIDDFIYQLKSIQGDSVLSSETEDFL